MAYTALEGSRELLDGLAGAIDELDFALASLGAAYEQLDVATAEALEETLFGPAQQALGRAKRTHAAFARRAGAEVDGPEEPRSAGLPSTGAHGFIDNAADALSAAGGRLATLQDSPLLLEVGDAELRKGLTEVRELIADLPRRARELTRRLGR